MAYPKPYSIYLRGTISPKLYDPNSAQAYLASASYRRLSGLGFRVQGLGFRVEGSVFRV